LKFDHEKTDHYIEVMVKMTLIIRDLMIGNPVLKDMGYGKEAEGHNAIASGLQGQRAWTDFMVNGDFAETILNSSFDWNGIRQPFVVATENDALNGIPMLLEHLLTGQTSIFSDVRTYWSTEAVKRVTGHVLDGRAKDCIIHLINSGSTTLDGTGEMRGESGNPVMKPFWDIKDNEVKSCLKATRFCPANREYFRGGGFSTDFLTRGGTPVTMARINLVRGLGPVLQIAEGHTVDLPENVYDTLDSRTDPTWPSTWFVPILTGQGAFRYTWGATSANRYTVFTQNITEGAQTVMTPLQKLFVTNDVALADHPNYIYTPDEYHVEAKLIFEEYDSDGLLLGIYYFTYNMPLS
jgi:L-fucose/D-arabinose isomerase